MIQMQSRLAGLSAHSRPRRSSQRLLIYSPSVVETSSLKYMICTDCPNPCSNGAKAGQATDVESECSKVIWWVEALCTQYIKAHINKSEAKSELA